MHFNGNGMPGSISYIDIGVQDNFVAWSQTPFGSVLQNTIFFDFYMDKNDSLNKIVISFDPI